MIVRFHVLLRGGRKYFSLFFLPGTRLAVSFQSIQSRDIKSPPSLLVWDVRVDPAWVAHKNCTYRGNTNI